MSLLQKYFADCFNMTFDIMRATLSKDDHGQEIRTYTALVQSIRWYLTVLSQEQANKRVDWSSTLSVNGATHKLYTDQTDIKVGDKIRTFPLEYDVLFIYPQYDQGNKFDHNIIYLWFVVQNGY